MKRVMFLLIVFSLFMLMAGCAYDKVTRQESEGIDHLVQGDVEEFKADIRDAYSQAPDDPFVMNNMGVVYELEGDLQRAREMYGKAVENAGERRVTKSSKDGDAGRLLKDVARDNLKRVEGEK